MTEISLQHYVGEMMKIAPGVVCDLDHRPQGCGDLVF